MTIGDLPEEKKSFAGITSALKNTNLGCKRIAKVEDGCAREESFDHSETATQYVFSSLDPSRPLCEDCVYIYLDGLSSSDGTVRQPKTGCYDQNPLLHRSVPYAR